MARCRARVAVWCAVCMRCCHAVVDQLHCPGVMHRLLCHWERGLLDEGNVVLLYDFKRSKTPVEHKLCYVHRLPRPTLWRLLPSTDLTMAVQLTIPAAAITKRQPRAQRHEQSGRRTALKRCQTTMRWRRWRGTSRPCTTAGTFLLPWRRATGIR